jgi:ribosomal protein S4
LGKEGSSCLSFNREERREGWRKWEKRERKKGERESCRENGEKKKKSLKNRPIKIFLFNEEL